MGRGRKPLTDKDPAFLEKLRYSYERNHGSMRAIAKDLGITHPTASKYVREHLHLPIVMKDMHSLKPEVTSRPGHSCFDDFVREHPDVKLPRSFAKMAEVTGCSRNSLKFLFYMRRKKIKQRLTELPDLRSVNKLMRSVDDELFSTKDIKQYVLSFDRWTFEVFVLAFTTDERFVLFMLPNVRDYGEFVLRKVSGDHLGWALRSEREKQGRDLPDLRTAKSALLNALGNSRGEALGNGEETLHALRPAGRMARADEKAHIVLAELDSQYPEPEDQ